jgi:hypothetical protein
VERVDLNALWEESTQRLGVKPLHPGSLHPGSLHLGSRSREAGEIPARVAYFNISVSSGFIASAQSW